VIPQRRPRLVTAGDEAGWRIVKESAPVELIATRGQKIEAENEYIESDYKYWRYGRALSLDG